MNRSQVILLCTLGGAHLPIPTALRVPARLSDLWRNAQLRAVASRYPDAVARPYTFIERTGQRRFAAKGSDTSDLRPGQIPPALAIAPDREVQDQAGRCAALALVVDHQVQRPAKWAARERECMRDRSVARNASILAQGDRPVDLGIWEGCAAGVSAALAALLTRHGTRVAPVGENRAVLPGFPHPLPGGGGTKSACGKC